MDVNAAVLHRGAHLCQSEVGITILAAFGLHKVGVSAGAPDMSKMAEAAGNVLVRMGSGQLQSADHMAWG